MRCLLMFAVVIMWSVSEAAELREVQLRIPPTCGYDGRSFFVFENLGSIPSRDSDEGFKWCYFGPHSRAFGDTESVAHVTPGMTAEVLRQLNILRPDMPKLRGHPLTAADLLLTADYRFPDSSDLYVVKYKVNVANPNMFVAFTKDGSRAYILASPPYKSIIADTAERVFNRLLSENPGVLNESPLCQAQLLVLCKFYAQFAPMILPSDPQEALGYLAMLQIMAQRETPPYLRTFDDLFLSGIGGDTLAVPYSRWNTGRLELASELRKLMPKDSSLWLPPETVVKHDTITVSFTASDANLGKLARWRVVFVRGLVMSVHAVAGPYNGPVYDLCSSPARCPFDYLAGPMRPHVDYFDEDL